MIRWTVWLPRSVSVLLLAGGSIGVGAPQQRTSPAAVPTERAVLDRYCSAATTPSSKPAGFALDTIGAENVNQHPEAWEKVVRKLRARYMPPAGLPRPDERTYDALVSSLESSLDTRGRRQPNPGRTDTFRRLNRTEYQNAIRDLLALDVDVAALLPSDESSHGFDNVTVGESLADAARALPLGRAEDQPPGGRQPRAALPAATPSRFRRTSRRRSTSTSCRSARAAALVVHYTFPLDAEYEIQLRLARDRNEHVEGLDRAARGGADARWRARCSCSPSSRRRRATIITPSTRI